MPRKEIQDAMHPAKKEVERHGKPTFLDGINISRQATGASAPVIFAFGPKGKQIENKDKAFAYYSETAEGSRTYYVKFATAGPAQGRMLNTSGMSYRPGDENKYENDLGRMTYKLKMISLIF